MPTVYSLPWFFQQFCDENGAPLAGGYIETKAAGTSDDKATYSESTGTTPHANPVVLDAAGMPDAGPIFLQADPYDFYVYDSDDNLKATIEGISSFNSPDNIETDGNATIAGGLYVNDLGAGIRALQVASDGSKVKIECDIDIGYTYASGVTIGNPTGGNKGGGTLNANAVYDDNVLLTGYVLDKAFNPDFSLEKWNKITRGRAEEFDKRANIMLNIDNYSKFIEENRVLPTFEEIEKNERQAPTGEMIQKLWEVVEIQAVHIKQLNDRLRMVEETCR
jgi:hypothetical protein